jgi:hypothetical protein
VLSASLYFREAHTLERIMQDANRSDNLRISATAPGTGESHTEIVGTGLAKGIAEEIAHGAPNYRSEAPAPDRGTEIFGSERLFVALLVAFLSGIIVGRFFAN